MTTAGDALASSWATTVVCQARRHEAVKMTGLEILFAVVASLLTVGGWLAGYSYGRLRRLRIAQDRVQPYGKLWAATEMSRASRIASGEPLTSDEARCQAKKLRDWYYSDHGGAMLLPIPTLKMLLLILHDLDILSNDDALNDSVRELLGSAILVEISVLRSQLKIDLDVYDLDEGAQLRKRARSDDDYHPRMFLKRACMDVEAWGRPERWWRNSPFHWRHYADPGGGDVVPLGRQCGEASRPPWEPQAVSTDRLRTPSAP